MVGRRINFVLDRICNSVLEEMEPSIIEQALHEVDTDLALNSVVDDVITALIRSVAAEELKLFQKNVEKENFLYDRTLVEEHAREIIGKKLLVSHLMMTIADGFDQTLIKHFMRGMIDRMILQRYVKR